MRRRTSAWFLVLLCCLLLCGCGEGTQRLIDGTDRALGSLLQDGEEGEELPTEAPEEIDETPVEPTELPDPEDPELGFYTILDPGYALPGVDVGALAEVVRSQGIEKLPTAQGIDVKLYQNTQREAYAMEVSVPSAALPEGRVLLAALLEECEKDGTIVAALLAELDADCAASTPLNELYEFGKFRLRAAEFQAVYHFLVLPEAPEDAE